jgi:F420-non-reducing hydrogenase iron-sulfur subunit
MCSARVRPEFVVTALSKGLDGVLVLGRHPGDCHYSEGNYFTRRRGLLLQKLLGYVGIELERSQVRWVSASEGAKFADIVEQVTKQIKDLGPRPSQRSTPPPEPGEM